MTTMNRKIRKKLIEVALPLEAINKGAEEDKNRKTGHIRNLHKWFAPMPLPAWRAMLFAALVDEPVNDAGGAERSRLFGIVERLSRFDAYKDRTLLDEVKAEIRRNVGEENITVLDPFCGGGSTILEAQRLGLNTIASDLNPIPVLITTAICRIAPLFGAHDPINPQAHPRPIGGWSNFDGLKSDIRYFGQLVRARAWERLKAYYPSENGTVPTAYRWAWSVASPDPSAKGRYTPLVSDWVLSKHRSSYAWISFNPNNNRSLFSVSKSGVPPKGNTGRSGATCLITGSPITLDYIRSEGRAGRLRPCLVATASRRDSLALYSAPNDIQIRAATEIPETELVGIDMPDAALGFRVQQYGIHNFLGLFTKRQAFSLAVFADEVEKIREEILQIAREGLFPRDQRRLFEGGCGSEAYADAITTMLGLCVGKMAQSNNILVRWFVDPRNGSGKATPSFDRHAVPMVWDFVETNPFGGSVGDWTGPVMETALRAFDLCVAQGNPAVVQQSDARDVSSSVSGSTLIATDPPYYANIGYADLSDFFYQWIRPALRKVFPQLLSTVATPKEKELIATPFRHQGSTEIADEYFRSGFCHIFHDLADKTDGRFPILIVYALKQADDGDDGQVSTGWEVFLGGLIDAGLSIVATWPVRTTTNTRMIGIGNNALASAIFVICRKMPADAGVATRRDFLVALKAELPAALRDLQASNIAPVDLAQAAIGPGMSVYSRYSRVLDTAGRPVTVGDALALINQTLDEALTEQEGDFDADSRWALAWFEQNGFAEGEYGMAETLSKAKNTSVAGLDKSGILKSSRGKVRLLKPNELPLNWNPMNDQRMPAWEVVHHLVRVLGSGGEAAAAALVSKLGARAETARELAYRLYTICERKKRAAEAISYNSLVQSWPEIVRLAQDGGSRAPEPDMFEESES